LSPLVSWVGWADYDRIVSELRWGPDPLSLALALPFALPLALGATFTPHLTSLAGPTPSVRPPGGARGWGRSELPRIFSLVI